MKTTLFYGLILAAINIVLTLVGFFLGFQTDKIAEGRWFGFLTFILAIVIIWLGTKAVREEAKDKALSYGKGVASGVLISAYSGLLTSVYSFVHLTFINPNFREYMLNSMREKWTAAHMTDAQMEAAEKVMNIMMSPVMASISGLIMSVLFGLVVALVVSAFLKREPQAEFRDATPAV
jgi:uncharacterized membrane protein YfcA